MARIHNANNLIIIFNDLFKDTENTILVGGAAEPLYLPGDDNHPHHRVVFTLDYFASALHEIAHWCIAGAERRLLVDYGYWYYPEGRDQEQQLLFEKAEVRPQALECIFSEAAGFKFRVSQDNLSRPETLENSRFADAVARQVEIYRTQGLPPRAALFYQALTDHSTL